ncbi:MAG: glycoside hydrolase, partial [Acidobacteria bacterium]|nr:glycoside hydrolase [Acidobacteriota bacterium]
TRLHALKDYYGMVAMLEEFPRVHMTFNLVPSLLLQLEDYAAGTAREPMQEMAFKPVETLGEDDKLFLLRYFFQANPDHLVFRYPRYRELWERMQANGFVAEKALPFFQTRDFADLQVLSQLAWFDEIFLAKDAELGALVAQGRGYGPADQGVLENKQRQLLREVFQAYRAAEGRGQVELSTSPFYHPILPLLCDTNAASQAHPGVRLPRRRFRHPEDARLQLERAIELHRRLFGSAPRGLWPSEGSVSAEVLEICAALGFRWAATDQRVLGNSIGTFFYRDPSGSVANAERLYVPYSFATSAGPVQLLFRDQELSDRIGFVYSRVEPQAAAADLLHHIRQGASPMLRQGKTATVSIILDGENAWEYFPQNGRPFLRALYGIFSDDRQVECVTVSEALERYGTAEPLRQLAPGSWINANFDIWIGAEEDNQAWDLLSEARDFFAENQAAASPEQRALALEEILAAEGSDWNWWYGPEHSTANDPDFDELYRSHLANVYRALGQRPPEALAQPIARVRYRVISVSPEAAISPQIDGKVSNYFEWMGSGYYSPILRAGAMHGQAALMRELYYGRDAENFFLRIDFHDPAFLQPGRVKLRVLFRGAAVPAVAVNFISRNSGQGLGCEARTEGSGTAPSAPLGQGVLEKILELQLPLADLGIQPDRALEFQATLWENDFPLESFPLEGWLAAPVPS